MSNTPSHASPRLRRAGFLSVCALAWGVTVFRLDGESAIVVAIELGLATVGSYMVWNLITLIAAWLGAAVRGRRLRRTR